MGKSKRATVQIFLWLLVWGIILFNQGFSTAFMKDNLPVLICQIFIVILITWYIAPKLIFTKKYFIFILLSVLIIFGTAYLSKSLIPPPHHPKFGPGHEPGGPRPGRPLPMPPQFLIHLLLIGIAYSIATMLEIFVYAQKKEEEHIRGKNENLQTELKLLKSQINPHFLFNSLNNIYALAAIDATKTQQSISYLSDMLRYVLYECEQQWVPLEKEILYIQNYIKLFSLKSSKEYPIATQFEIKNSSILVAPMLFIPFVENALKHSNIEQIKDTFIRIKLYADMDHINFTIENSIPKTPINKDALGGIGIENVKRRLSILYPDQHQIKLVSAEDIFKVQLNLMIDEKD